MSPDQRKGKGLRKRCRSGIYTDDLSRADLLALANLPSHKAAEKAGLGITAFKKICRKRGILRWPYQKTSQQKAHGGWPSTSTNSSGAEEEGDESDWQEGAGQVPASGEVQSLLQPPPLPALPLLPQQQPEQPVRHAAVQQPVRGLLDLLASAAEADSACSTPQPSGSATDPVMRPRALRVLGPGEVGFERGVLQRKRVPGWREPVALPSLRSAFVPYTQPTLRLAFTSAVPDLSQPASPAAAGVVGAGSLSFSFPSDASKFPCDVGRFLSDATRYPSDASRPGGSLTPLPPVASVLLPPTPAEYTPRLSRAEAPQLLAQQVQQLVLQQAQHQQDLARVSGTAAAPAAATTLGQLGRQGSSLAAAAAAYQQQQQPPPSKGQDELLGQLRQAQAVWRRYKAMAQSLDAARQQAEQAAAAEGALLPTAAEGPGGGGWSSSLSEQLKHSAAGAVGSWLQSLTATAARGERPATRMPPPPVDARPAPGYGAAAIPDNSGASMWRNSMTAPSAC